MLVQGHCEVYVLVAFHEFVTSTSDADVAAVLTQLLQLHAAYSITCQAADFIEVCCGEFCLSNTDMPGVVTQKTKNRKK